MGRQSNRRGGCGRLLPLTALACGALACAWGFYLGQTQAGQEVDTMTGVSFYLGWFCGLSMIGISVILFLLQGVLGAVGGLVGRITGSADFLPNNADLGFLDNLFNRRD